MNIGFVATRLAGVDGVSLETRKMAAVLEGLGHTCHFIAGALEGGENEGTVVPEMHFSHPVPRRHHDEAFAGPSLSRATMAEIHDLADHLRDEIAQFVQQHDIDVLIPQNSVTIPMNLSLGIAITDYIRRTQIAAVAHHHDFYWERERFMANGVQDILDDAFPPNLASMRHLVINTPMQQRLRQIRGITARYLPNVFHFETAPPAADAYALTFRQQFDLAPADLIVLQPTRIVRRKGIEKAVELIRRLEDQRLVLVLTGGGGDEAGEYGDWIQRLADAAGIRYRMVGPYVDGHRDTKDGRNVYTLWDLYPQAHLVTYPSTYEGFGNALIEAVYFRKPFIVHRYPVYLADIRPAGIRAVEFTHDLTPDVLDGVRALIDDEALRAEVTANNYQVGLAHFSYAVLRQTMESEMKAVHEFESHRTTALWAIS
jgi:mannosylglucosylglycerate synthase